MSEVLGGATGVFAAGMDVVCRAESIAVAEDTGPVSIFGQWIRLEMIAKCSPKKMLN